MDVQAGRRYYVKWHGEERLVEVKAIRTVAEIDAAKHEQQYYCHLVGQDSRLDEWLCPSHFIRPGLLDSPGGVENDGLASASTSLLLKAGQKRKREREAQSPAIVSNMATKGDNPTTSLAPRSVTSVVFGSYEIRCWYSSPYPIDDFLKDGSGVRGRVGTPISSLSAGLPLSASPSVNMPKPRVPLARQSSKRVSRQSQSLYQSHDDASDDADPEALVRAVTSSGRPARLRTRGRLSSTMAATPPGEDASNYATSASRMQLQMQNLPNPDNLAVLHGNPQQDENTMLDAPAQNSGVLPTYEDVKPVVSDSAPVSLFYQPQDSSVSAYFSQRSIIENASSTPLRLNGGSVLADLRESMESKDHKPAEGLLPNDTHSSAAGDETEEEDFSSPNYTSARPDTIPNLPSSHSLPGHVTISPKPPSVANSPERSASPLKEVYSAKQVTRPVEPETDPATPALLSRQAKPRKSTKLALSAPLSASSAAESSRKRQIENSNASKLYVCEGCFKYFVHAASYAVHVRACIYKAPPGKKVYQRGAHTIWEVDGEAAKLYCQNLCLFGKLFIDHKYVFFETSGFLFYVLTEARPSFDHVLGFFSKEKVSYNDYNLACIVTFPPYQKRGFGTLLIEFSYELSSRSEGSRRAGTPERPLSDLGLRGYLQYWTSVLCRYFRLIFHTRNDPRLVLPTPTTHDSSGANAEADGKRKKHWKGFQGEVGSTSQMTASLINSVPLSPRKTRAEAARSSAIDTASVASHQEPSTPSGPSRTDSITPPTNEAFQMHFSLAEIANATHLRQDDVAFALVHSGLARFRAPPPTLIAAAEEDDSLLITDDDLELIIAPGLVEDIVVRFKVKHPVMSRAHCLL